MICIFEVFALNRNEDDFLENLGILNETRLQQNSESQPSLREEEESPTEVPEPLPLTDLQILETLKSELNNNQIFEFIG